MLRIPIPDPPLSDEHVRLRPWRHADADVLERGWLDDEVAKWNPVPDDRSLQHAQRWIGGWGERQRVGLSIDFVIVAPDDAPAGEVGLSSFDELHGAAEIGFWLLPEFRGRGLAGSAVALVARWATEVVGVRLLHARTHADNGAAQGVLHAAGFIARGNTGDGRLVWKYERHSAGDRDPR